MWTILSGGKLRVEEMICMLCFVIVCSAGSDGETGQSSMWRWVRESEESLSQTAAVSGDGETQHITTAG